MKSVKSKFSIRLYLIKVKHDLGTIKFKVFASSKESAISMVLKAENCPLSAISKVTRLQ